MPVHLSDPQFGGRRIPGNPGGPPGTSTQNPEPVLGLSAAFARGQRTRGQITALGNEATGLEGLRGSVNAAISNAPNRQGQRISSAAGVAVQHQFGDAAAGAVTHADALDNALKRAKARTGIADRGDAAVRNQQLKDRLTQVRAGIRAKGRAINLQVQGQNIQSGVNVGGSSAKDRSRAAVADAFGTAFGAGAATLKENKTRTGSLFNFGES